MRKFCTFLLILPSWAAVVCGCVFWRCPKKCVYLRLLSVNQKESMVMAFDKTNIFAARDLERLREEGPADYVAHVICTAGRAEFTFDGRDFALCAGETMIILLRRLVERLHCSVDFAGMCLDVRQSFLEACTPRSNYGIRGSLALHENPVMRPDGRRFARLCGDFEQIELRLSDDENPWQEETLMCAAQMMFLDYFELHAAGRGEAVVSAQDADLMERFLRLLERGDYVKHREVGHYAAALFVTPKYLSEVCKGVSGRAAGYWITRFALIHIRRLLRAREMSFTQISDFFGFSSPAYFSRFVQKHLGTSPSGFRQ